MIKFIRENKIQAQRDLDSARVLLASSDPHLENVAFLLEQSFEKIVKTAYTRYKFETDPTSWEEVYENIRGHDIDFILTMMADLYKNWAKALAQLPEAWFDYIESHNVFPKEIEEIWRSPENTIKTIKQIPNLKEDVTYARENFTKFLSELDSESIGKLDTELFDIPQFFTTVENLTDSANDTTDFNRQTFQEHMTFLILFVLAPYALSHAIHSRYPLKEHDMCNLEAYRNNPNLREFFDTLADGIQKMLDSETGFTKLLIEAYSFNYDMS